MEEVDYEKKSEVDELGLGAEDVGAVDYEMEVEDRGLWLKPQRLDFADISELDFDSNFTDQEGSSCDVLNTVQKIEFSSQSTEEPDMKRSPDIISSQDMFSSDSQYWLVCMTLVSCSIFRVVSFSPPTILYSVPPIAFRSFHPWQPIFQAH